MVNFSIIALRILQGNPNIIKKILPEPENKEGNWYLFSQQYKVVNDKLRLNEEYPLSDDFFGANISISAIVGKNGSGKSSLLEFMFRMINNLSFWLLKKQQRSAAEHFYYIPDIYGDLYFVIGGELGVLHCRGDFVGMKVGSNKWGFNFSFDQKQSIPAEFRSYRIKEEVLVKEFIEIAKTFFYTIATNYSLQAFLDSDYKEDRSEYFDANGKSGSDSTAIWINSIFHKNDGYSAPIVLNPYRDGGVINLETESQLTSQRLAAILVQSKKNGTQFIDDYQLNSIAYKYAPTNILRKFPIYKDTEELRLDFLSAWDSDNYGIETYSSAILKQFGFAPSSSLKNWEIDACIYLVYKTLNIASKYPSYIQFAEITKDLSAKEYDENFSFLVNNFEKEESKDRVEKAKNNLLPLFKRQVAANIANKIDDLVKYTLKDKSHITLKIRQTLNFLKECDVQKLSDSQKDNINFTYDEYISTFQSQRKLGGLSKIMEFLPPPFFEYEITLDKVEKGKIISDIDNPISFKTMSSGEKQFLYAVSTLIYHMKNLRSVPPSRVHYRHFNLVLDEIEICFHPEYQRKFINKLIEVIKRLRLNDRHSKINITIATHSPFILSDIPNCNILYLEKGKVKNGEISISPFGANINDILKQSFFLDDGFMGEYAQKRINSLLYFLGSKSEENKEWDKTRADEFIDLIGEPIIKQELRFLYDAKFEGINTRIARLKKELEELEGKK